MTRDEALVVLQSGEFEPFVGQREDLELEFKREPYQLDEEPGKFELAKDVAALANGAGGVIVVGIETERLEDSPLDEAVRVRPFDRELVDTTRYEAVVGEHVYPPVQGLRAEFKPTAGDTDRGLALIDVAPASRRAAVRSGERMPGGAATSTMKRFSRADSRRPPL